MKMPGFNAEVSLFKASDRYRTVAVGALCGKDYSVISHVVPQALNECECAWTDDYSYGVCCCPSRGRHVHCFEVWYL
jgi:hypothetical protein